MNVAIYVTNKTIRLTATYTLKNGIGSYTYENKSYTNEKFDELFPIKHDGILTNFTHFEKGENPDKTKIK